MQIIAWLVNSSKDPKRWSVFILSAAGFVIPYIIHVLDLSCGWGIACIVGVDAASLNAVAEAISNIAFYVSSTIAAIGVVYGFARKVYLSVIGRNRSLENL